MTRYFYVCSYGGCGSTVLCNALKPYGQVEHIHSRNPPEQLEYIGQNGGGSPDIYHEWFNGIPIPEPQVHQYTVLYIYRNPIDAIMSRFRHLEHLEHIQLPDKFISLDDVRNNTVDSYKIHEFHNNYMQYRSPTRARNNRILCIRYEELFERQNELSQLLHLPNLHLVKRESEHLDLCHYIDGLTAVYDNLIHEMNSNDFITIR